MLTVLERAQAPISAKTHTSITASTVAHAMVSVLPAMLVGIKVVANGIQGAKLASKGAGLGAEKGKDG